MEYGFSKSSIAAAENYHDLKGLQSIKQEENQDLALKKVAKQFESLFVNELLKNMRSANKVFEEDNLFNSSESNMFRDMYDQQLSVHLSSGKGLGLSEVIYQQLSRQYANDADAESGKAEYSVPERKSYPDLVSKSSDSFVQTDGSDIKAGGPGTKGDKEDISVFNSASDFVEKLMPYAKKVADKLAVNPLILVAQAALETGWGKHVTKSDDGSSSFNLFNIKADSRWQGDRVSVVSAEYRDGVVVQERSNFRKYESFEESFDDFLQFLQSNPRYEMALQSSQSDEQFVHGLQDAGYATDPNYAEKILRVFRSAVNASEQDVQGTK